MYIILCSEGHTENTVRHEANIIQRYEKPCDPEGSVPTVSGVPDGASIHDLPKVPDVGSKGCSVDDILGPCEDLVVGCEEEVGEELQKTGVLEL